MRKALDLDTLPGGKHLAAVIEITTRIRRDHAQLLDEIAELEHAQTAQFAGYATLSALLAEVLHIARGDATRMVTQSELVAETVTPIGYTAPAKLPKVREALHEGVLDPKHVDAIARVVKDVPGLGQLRTPRPGGDHADRHRPGVHPAGGGRARPGLAGPHQRRQCESEA